MLSLAKRVLLASLWGVLGRRNLVRLARFLDYQSRLDVPNQMETNGELLLQARVRSLTADWPSTTVIDVGANVGDWTAAVLGAFAGRPALGIHLFEPAPVACERLRVRFASELASGRVHLEEAAVSAECGEGTLHVAGSTSAVHSLYAANVSGASVPVGVRLVTLDDYCARHGIDRVALVKIDTEGHDLHVLRGAERILTDGRAGLVQFEYNWRWIEARAFLRDVFELAGRTGHRVGKLTPRGVEFYRGWDRELETFHEANFVLCRTEWLSALPQIRWWNEPP
jgi:FkbM family methyltransferase